MTSPFFASMLRSQMKSNATPRGAPPPLVELTWDGNAWDGLFNWLGQGLGQGAWANPHPTYVSAAQSSNQDGTRTANKALDHSLHATSGSTHTQNIASSWWRVDFLTRRCWPTRIGVQNRAYFDSNNCKLLLVQASDDLSAWTQLTSFTNANGDSVWTSVEVPSEKTWRYLRLQQSGTNWAGGHYMTMGEVEVWGSLYDETDLP